MAVEDIIEEFNQMEDYSEDEYIVRRKRPPEPMMVVVPSELSKTSADMLDEMRTKSPRVLCFAHPSVVSFVADAVLALGAEPKFVEDSGEATQMSGASDAMFACVGAISKPQADVVRAAVARANALQKPWSLDPDDSGFLSLRSYVAKELMRRYPSIIRGNPAEILALSGLEVSDDSETMTAARRLAEVTRAAVVITGAEDHVCGENAPISTIGNGTPMLTRLSGIGAVQGAIGAAMLAVSGRHRRYEAAAATSLTVSIAGELAAARAKSPGAFSTAFIDALAELKPADIAKRAKISVME